MDPVLIAVLIAAGMAIGALAAWAWLIWEFRDVFK